MNVSASQAHERQNCSSINVMSSILDWNMKLFDWELDMIEEGDGHRGISESASHFSVTYKMRWILTKKCFREKGQNGTGVEKSF